jgi:TonB family protein
MKTGLRKAALATVLLVTCTSVPITAQQEQSVNDKDIEVISFQEMAYPALAHQARIGGTVVIRVRLDDKGNVTEATAISGALIITASALANVKTWTFRPNAAKSAVVVYEFRIFDGRCKGNPSLFVLQGANRAVVMTCPPALNVSSQ